MTHSETNHAPGFPDRGHRGSAVTDQPADWAPASTSDPGDTSTSEIRDDRVPGLVWGIAAVFVAIELAVSARYGFEQDELYFLVAGHHLAFGYVDQGPLTPLLTRLASAAGTSPTVIRVIPALAGAAVVVLAARLAALFGARRNGRVLAALVTACAPFIMGGVHVFTTTPLDLLAWAVTLLCVSTALLRDRPRWWLGAGAATGLGLENKNLLVLLVAGLALGLLVSPYRAVLRTKWPWLGAAVAAVIWAPNLIWQATNGWAGLVLASSLHHTNSSLGDYVAGLPDQLIFPGLLVIPVLIAGFVRLWRQPELRFIAVACTLIVVYVLVWVPGKPYYSDGMVPAVLAAGSVSAERWAVRGRRPRLRRGLVFAAPVVGMVVPLATLMPVLPVADLHEIPGISQVDPTMTSTIGWPQLTAAVAAQDAALARAGQAPTSVFSRDYPEAAALQVLGTADHLPPVLSGQNAYWTWGPGRASDRTVLVINAFAQLRPYFASCRVLTTFIEPYQIHDNWSGAQIGVCTGPVAGWRTLWPHLKRYM